jgi:hypothetical protein
MKLSEIVQQVFVGLMMLPCFASMAVLPIEFSDWILSFSTMFTAMILAGISVKVHESSKP